MSMSVHVDHKVLRELLESLERPTVYKSSRRCSCVECGREFEGRDLVYIDETDFYCCKCACRIFSDSTDDLDSENLKYAQDIPEFYDYE